MPVEKRPLYSSANGDKWSLARDPASGSVFIRHEANLPSGGRITDIEIGTFGETPRTRRAASPNRA